MPPFYLEWFQSRFPQVLLPTEKKLILQALNSIQGIKTAGKKFNDRINSILTSEPLSMTRCAADYRVYCWEYEDDLVLLCISTELAYIRDSIFVRSLILLDKRLLKYVSRRLFYRISWCGKPFLLERQVDSFSYTSLLIGTCPISTADERADEPVC